MSYTSVQSRLYVPVPVIMSEIGFGDQT